MDTFRLNNMKSFVDSGNVEIKPITIFIGKNSSGKSSLVRFPIVLKQTIEESISPLLFYGKHIDYGNYEDIIFNHKEEENVSFSLTINLKDIIGISETMPFALNFDREDQFKNLIGCENGAISVSIEVGRQLTNKRFLGDLEVKKFTLKINDKELLLIKRGNSKYETYLKGEYKDQLDVGFTGFIPHFDMIQSKKRKYDNNEFGDNETDQINSIRSLLRVIDTYFSNTVANISYIGPFRRIPDRNYRYQEANKLSIGSDGSYTSELLASYHRRNDTSFFKKLNNWLAEHLHIHIEVEDLKGGMYRIVVKDLETGVKNNIIDVGFGLSQVLPIIVQVLDQGNERRNKLSPAYRVRERFVNKINIVEQPELHLHPYAQSNLADLFIMGSRLKNKNCFIVETHSEHLILRLRRRILEGSVRSEEVAIYYVEKDLDFQNGSRVKKLDLDSQGNIKDWPKDFFDQDYKEIMQINRLKAKMDTGEEEW